MLTCRIKTHLNDYISLNEIKSLFCFLFITASHTLTITSPLPHYMYIPLFISSWFNWQRTLLSLARVCDSTSPPALTARERFDADPQYLEISVIHVHVLVLTHSHLNFLQVVLKL